MSGKNCHFLTRFAKHWALVIAFSALSTTSVLAQEEASEEAAAVDLVSAEVDDMSASTEIDEIAVDAEPEDKSLADEVESLKQAALELNRDLLILEEELLFPANTQIMVFLSVDVGNYFRLDAVKLSIDDKLVASHLYTGRQLDALSRGGIQRLYVGNIKTGDHEVTAIFTGIGPDNREYKRGATIVIEKDDDPKMLELRIRDSRAKMQPEFDFKEWQL